MKRHIQEIGIRNWYGQDLVELQSEPLKVLDEFFTRYGNFVVSGFTVTEVSGGYMISEGVAAFREKTQNRGFLAFFAGTESPVSFPGYVVLSEKEHRRKYKEPEQTLLIAREYAAVYHEGEYNGGDLCFKIDKNAIPRFSEVIQTQNNRFVTGAEFDKWNGLPSLNSISDLANAALSGVLNYVEDQFAGLSDPATFFSRSNTYFDKVITSDRQLSGLDMDTTSSHVLLDGVFTLNKQVWLNPNIKSLTGTPGTRINVAETAGLFTKNIVINTTPVCVSFNHICSINNIAFKFQSSANQYSSCALMGFTGIRDCSFETDFNASERAGYGAIHYCRNFINCSFALNGSRSAEFAPLQMCDYFNNCRMELTSPTTYPSLNNCRFFTNCMFYSVNGLNTDHAVNCWFHGGAYMAGNNKINCTEN